MCSGRLFKPPAAVRRDRSRTWSRSRPGRGRARAPRRRAPRCGTGRTPRAVSKNVTPRSTAARVSVIISARSWDGPNSSGSYPCNPARSPRTSRSLPSVRFCVVAPLVSAVVPVLKQRSAERGRFQRPHREARSATMQVTKSSIETVRGPSDWFTGAVYTSTRSRRLRSLAGERELGPLHARRTHRLAHPPERPDDLRPRGRRARAAARGPDRGHPARRPSVLRAWRGALARCRGDAVHGPSSPCSRSTTKETARRGATTSAMTSTGPSPALEN